MACSKELSNIQTEVEPVLKSGQTGTKRGDIDNGAKKAFCVWPGEGWCRFRRYYWDLILNKFQIGLNDLAVETAKERIIESIDQLAIYCERNANTARNLVFQNEETATWPT